MHTFNFTVESNEIFNGAAAATITATHQPPTGGSYLKVTVSGGTSNSGTVSISGTLGGVAKTDTLTFSSARFYITVNQYDVISSITTTGLADEATKPNVKIEACDITGNPLGWISTSTYYGRINTINSKSYGEAINGLNSGFAGKSLFSAKIDGDQNIKIGQLFMVVGRTEIFTVLSEPIKHMQLDTDLIDSVQFLASIKSK